MSDSANPYQSPEADTEVIKPLTVQGALTETMVKYLNGASPWMRFIGIVGFIGSGALVLLGILSFGFFPMASSLNLFGEVSFFLGSLAPVMAIYAVNFIGGGVLMFFPAFFTYRFGVKIRKFTQTNSEQELEQAFKNNKSLWKFNGIVTIVGLAIIPVLIVIVIVVAFASMALF